MDTYTIQITDDEGYEYRYRVSRAVDGSENYAYVRTTDLIAALVSGAAGACRITAVSQQLTLPMAA